MKTKVIFRKFKNGDIIALFPELAGTFNPDSCQSYMHIGQHGAAGSNIVQDTKPATDIEYATLQDELERDIGYDLQIIKKFTYKHVKTRQDDINI